MRLKVETTTKLSGIAVPPSSKSQTIRGMFFSLLAKGESTLLNVLDSDDAQDAMRVCKQLGAEFSVSNGKLVIKSNGLPLLNTDSLHTGNSGITTRFVMPMLGLRQNTKLPIIVNCGEQMRARPIKPLVDALRNLGMTINYLENETMLPVSISGQLKGGKTHIDGMSSQYLSALLISLPCAEEDSVVVVDHLHERPYMEMTLNWLRRQQIQFTHQSSAEQDIFTIQGKQTYQPFETLITGDFSSASYLITAAALSTGSVQLIGLDMNDPQGDKRLVPILQAMGADIEVKSDRVVIHGGKSLKGMTIDANDIPDLLPTLAVIGTQASGKTEITNVKQARIKETDRIHSMTEGLTRMGAHIEEHENGMTVYASQLKGTRVKGYGDHRTVMALSVAGMMAQGVTSISDGEAINKTFPSYVEIMQSLGAKMEMKPILDDKHIILLGFKHVGKSIIGKGLAAQLDKDFIDLDEEIENFYEATRGEKLSCRQIMLQNGEAYFRQLETTVLDTIIHSESCIISLGGGTPLHEANQTLLKNHLLIQIVAPRGVVFERIMLSGRPAFFNPNEDAYETFNRLWKERGEIYSKLTDLCVNNQGSVDGAISQIMELISQKERRA